MENWCQDCQSEGKSVVAKWQVDGRWKCTGHFMAYRKEHPEEPKPLFFAGNGPPPAQTAPVREEEPQTMRPKLDYASMQIDRDAGMAVKDIAKKHKCSQASVSVNTKKPGAPPPARKLGRLESLAEGKREHGEFLRKRKAREEIKTNPEFVSNSTISELLAKYRARRDALDEAIAAMETVEKLLARSEELA